MCHYELQNQSDQGAVVCDQVSAGGSQEPRQEVVVGLNEMEQAELEFQACASRLYGLLKKTLEPEIMGAIKMNRHSQSVMASITVMLELAGELEAWLNETSKCQRNPMETIYEAYTHGYNHGFKRVLELKAQCQNCPHISACIAAHIVDCPKILDDAEGGEHIDH